MKTAVNPNVAMVNKYKLLYRAFLVIFWITSCWGFVGEELLTPLAHFRSAAFAICDMVLLLLGLLTISSRKDIIVVVSYLAIAWISTVFLNGESYLTLFNGTRDFFGLLFAVPLLRYFFTCNRAGDFRRDFDRQLRIWLYLQAFCITWQFLRYGANDHGGGTMGLGASGMVSMEIYIVSFYLVTRNWKGTDYIANLKNNWKTVLLLYPSWLNETKASFIFLILYFVLLATWNRKTIMRLAYVIPLGIISVVGVFSAYISITKQDASKMLTKEFFEEYLYGIDLDYMIDVALLIQDGKMDIDPKDWWTVDIPRFAKLVLISPELKDTHGGMAMGAGVGQFKGGSNVELTRFADKNQWLLQGSRPMTFFVYTQLGWVGFIWFLVVVSSVLFTRRRNHPFNLKLMVLMGVALTLILFYNDSFRFFNFCIIMFYIALAMYYPEKDGLKAVTSAEPAGE